ncbi:MAG: S8 family serine peptidase, partial [Pseudobdellovibrionaceae bacterium]
LAHLKTVIVEVSSEAELQALQKNAQQPNSEIMMVEKEVWHPLPEPVRQRYLANKNSVLNQASFAAEPSEQLPEQLPEQPWGIAAVKAQLAWLQSSKGSQSRVLVLDTGIDKDHPALRDNFESGKDFIGDSQVAPYPFFDGNGHGSHTAGTVAGAELSSGFTGVAPKTRILAGRVCASLGCPNTSIAQGINWGIEQKVDVISMSLGGGFITNTEKLAVQAAENAGVVIVAASGNSCTAAGTGCSPISFPAALPTAIAVGAINPELKKTEFSQFGPGLDVVAPGAAVVSTVPVGTGRNSKVLVGLPGKMVLVNSVSFTGAKDATEAEKNALILAGLGKPEDFAKINAQGKFVLVQRGEIKFLEKVQNAINARAAGVMIYNNTAGLTQGALTQDGSVLPVPVAMIEESTGKEIAKQLQAGVILDASIQTEKSDYASFDGTSMATPHVSGVVALMKSANRKLSPEQVRKIISETATALGPNDQNQYGAGLVNAEAAVNAAIMTPGQLVTN